MFNQTLGVAVIGTSRFAVDCHIPGIRSHPKARLLALVGRNAQKTCSMAKAHSIPIASCRLEEILHREEIGAVCIVSANVDHHAQALACIRAGKHVLCEKPLAMNVQQAIELARAARSSGKIHQVAFTFRHNHGIQRLRELLAEQFIGPPFLARIQYDRWDALSPNWKSSWRDDPASSGSGILFDLGSHLYDILGHVLGPLRETIGFTHTVPRMVPDSTHGHLREIATDDLSAAWCRHESGLMSQWFCSRVTPPFAELGYLEVIGPGGALKASLSRGGVDQLKHSTPEKPEWQQMPLAPEASDGKPHALRRMLHRFVDACLGESEVDDVAADFDDGLAVQAAMDRLLASQTTKTWQAIRMPDFLHVDVDLNSASGA